MVTDQAARLRNRAIGTAAVGVAGFTAVLTLVGIGWEPLRRLDHFLATDLVVAPGRTPWLANLLRVVDAVTDPWILMVAAGAVAVLLYRTGLRRIAVWLTSTVAVGWVVLSITKRVVDRPRPPLADVSVGLDAYSFPSGHAFASLLVLTALTFIAIQRRPPRRTAVALLSARTLLIVAIGLDRLTLPAHYLSDVLAGWFLAAAIFGASRLVHGLTRPVNLEAVARRGGHAPRVAVIVNPAKLEDLDGFRRLVDGLASEHGWQPPLWFETTVHDAGHEMARSALRAEVDLVVVAGGDGTVRIVCSELGGHGIPLGIVPIGTGNLLARNLAIPLDYEDAVEVALAGADRRIDLVEVEGDELVADHFAVMAGLGMDAAVVGEAPPQLKASVGWPAYVVSLARNVSYPPVRLWISVDGGPPTRERAIMVLVGNVGSLHGGLSLLPEAEPDDGYLDVVLVAPRTVTDWPRIAWRVVRRRHEGDEQLRHFRGREVVIRAEEPCPRQLDGDVVTSGRELRSKVLPGALVVRVPHERGHAHAERARRLSEDQERPEQPEPAESEPD